MTRKTPLHRISREIWDVARAASPTHLHLRDRLVSAVLVTFIIDALGSVVMFFLERGAPGSSFHSFGDALFWTTTQLLTISSSLPNPVTGPGQIVDVVLQLYAITVVTALAGMFGAFFQRRGQERDAERSAAAK